MARLTNPVPQYLDSSGDPLVSGKAYFFESETNTPKTTFADVNLTISNTHPVILDAAGRLPNTFFDGAAKMKLTNSSDVQIFERDPVSSEEATGNFAVWNSTVIYAANALVEGSDGLFYKSIAAANQGNDPTSVATAWSEVQFIDVWNTNVTYAAGVTVKGSDNLLYRSLVGSNLGNDPVGDTTNWGQPAALILGKQTVALPSGALRSSTTNGATALVVDETSVQKTDVPYLAFSNSTEQSVFFWVRMPKGYNAGTFTASMIWKHPVTATNFGVVWGVKILSMANDDDPDTAPGTEILVTDTGGTTDDFYFTAATAAITASNSPAKESLFYVKLSRKVGEAGDNLAVAAQLIDVGFFYTTDQAVDD